MNELPFKSKVSVINTLQLLQLFESKERKKKTGIIQNKFKQVFCV